MFEWLAPHWSFPALSIASSKVLASSSRPCQNGICDSAHSQDEESEDDQGLANPAASMPARDNVISRLGRARSGGHAKGSRWMDRYVVLCKFWRMQLNEVSWLPKRFFLVVFQVGPRAFGTSRFGPLAPFSSLLS